MQEITTDSIISSDHDNLETLIALENAVEHKSKISLENATEAAEYMFTILENRMWRHHVDEYGNQLYRSEKEYLPYLTRKVRWGRASIYSKKRALRLATGGLNLDFEDIKRLGGISRMQEVEKQVSQNGKISPRSGKIVQYNKDTGNLTPEEYILKGLEALSPANTDDMEQADVIQELHNHLSVRPTIRFYIIPLGENRYDIEWSRQVVKDGMTEFDSDLVRNRIPNDVLSYLARKLNCKNPLYAQFEQQEK